MNKKMKISGVYKVTNNITGDFYIGSSRNIKKRWSNHKSSSVWKRYPNSRLYKDMAQYGKDKFIFEVIEETTDLHNREQYYIEQLKPSYNSFWAYGHDTERYKEHNKAYSKEWYKAHQNEMLAKSKAYYEAHRDEHLAKCKAYMEAHRNELLAKSKVYYSRLCLYEGETLTLHALTSRLFRQGIPHATIEAKRYLIEKEE